ncbi:MAG: hypothetical protein WBQ25_16550 [Nitrososphaeraceae archaeon]
MGIVALAIVFLILLWNRELESTVEARTMELKKTNNYLIAANEQLKIRGLDPDLISSLFTKFATNSDQGVGLGLYTSKNIIMVEKYGQKTIKIREVQPFHLLCHYPK